jgi:hypothetical protein
MTDVIEITITRLPSGSARADTPMPTTVLATGRLVAIADRDTRRPGHGIHVSIWAASSDPAWERLGFIAADRHDDIWRVVARAATWAAHESEKRS